MIHYHGVAGGGKYEDCVTLATGRHCFVSYASCSNLPLFASVCSSFSLDNGAYTAWKQGKAFNFEGFVEFVKVWMQHPAFDWAVMPDVIDGSEEENDEFENLYKGQISKSGVAILPSKRTRKIPEVKKPSLADEALSELKAAQPEIKEENLETEEVPLELDKEVTNQEEPAKEETKSE